MKKAFNWFINGITNDNVFKRILFLYLWFFIVFILTTLISHIAFAEGFFRGKNTAANSMVLSKNVLASWMQMFFYNCIPLTLIISSSLITAKYKFTNQRFISMGYLAFTSLTIICAAYLGTWSFDVVTPAPSLIHRIVFSFDIIHNSGLIELSSYLVGAAASYKIALWYCDSKAILYIKRLKDIKLNISEKILLLMSFVLLLLAALIEAISISKIQ
jgi:hypothetical protein